MNIKETLGFVVELPSVEMMLLGITIAILIAAPIIFGIGMYKNDKRYVVGAMALVFMAQAGVLGLFRMAMERDDPTYNRTQIEQFEEPQQTDTISEKKIKQSLDKARDAVQPVADAW